MVVVDDVQWVDPASWSVLAFVANRLRESPVSLLLASRGDTSPPGLDDQPVLHLAPLGLADATSLLATADPTLDPIVRTSILERAAGNPLALLELSRLSASATRTRSSTSVHHAVPASVETAFAADLSALPAGTRSLLLLVAAGGDDLTLLSRTTEPAQTVAGGARTSRTCWSRAGARQPRRVSPPPDRVDGLRAGEHHPEARGPCAARRGLRRGRGPPGVAPRRRDRPPRRRGGGRAVRQCGPDDDAGRAARGVGSRGPGGRAHRGPRPARRADPGRDRHVARRRPRAQDGDLGRTLPAPLHPSADPCSLGPHAAYALARPCSSRRRRTCSSSLSRR